MNRKRKRSPSQDSDAGSADDGSCRSHPAVRSISDRPGGILEKYIDNRLQPIEDSVQALDDRHVKLRGYYEAHKKLLEQQHALRNSNAQSLQSTTNRLANRMTKVEGIVESQKATVQELEDLNEKSSLFDQARKEMLSNAAMLKTGEGEMEKRVVNVETAMTEKMAQSQGELQTLINTTEKQNVQNVATLRSDFISTINGVDDKTAKRIEKLEARIPPLVESNRSANTLISNTNQRLDNLTKDLEQIVLIQQKVTSLEQAQKEDSENFQTSLVALEQSQIDLKTLTTKNRERADTNLDALRTLAEDSCVKVTEQHERLKSVETTQKGIPETVEQTQEEVKAVRTQNENLKDQVTDHQALLDTTLPQQATAISDLLARVQTLENDEVRLDLCSRLKELEDKSASQEKELGIVKETLSKIQTKADQQVAEMETKCDQKVLEMQTKQEQLMLKMQTDFEKRLLELKQQQDLDREQRAKGTAEVYHTRERDAANISELRSSVEAVKQDQAAHVAECHQAMDPLSDTIIVAIQAESRRTRRACTGVIDTAVQTLKDRLDAVESTVKALESAPSNCTELAARVKALLLDMEIFEQKHQTREVGLANLRRRIKNSDALANSLNEAFEKLANLTTALDGTASKNELASVREQLKQLETQFSATIMAKLTHMDQICHGRKEGIQADIQEVRAVQDRVRTSLTHAPSQSLDLVTHS
tara:strand:- start:5221 stop:7338 length:2118 start_codon:yes stop_codon:yes gene_type:complete